MTLLQTEVFLTETGIRESTTASLVLVKVKGNFKICFNDLQYYEVEDNGSFKSRFVAEAL